MNDANFCNFMNPAELSAWTTFTNVVKFFLGKTKASDYKELVETLLTTGCKYEHQVTFFAPPSCLFSRKHQFMAEDVYA